MQGSESYFFQALPIDFYKDGILKNIFKTFKIMIFNVIFHNCENFFNGCYSHDN